MSLREDEVKIWIQYESKLKMLLKVDCTSVIVKHREKRKGHWKSYAPAMLLNMKLSENAPKSQMFI